MANERKFKHMKRILVPIDFSENSFNALEFGLEIANKLSADLRIVHVKTRRLAYRYSQVNEEAILKDSIEDWMKDIQEKYKDKYRVPGGSFDFRIREGNVFKEVSNVITSYSIHYTKLYDKPCLSLRRPLG